MDPSSIMPSRFKQGTRTTTHRQQNGWRRLAGALGRTRPPPVNHPPTSGYITAALCETSALLHTKMIFSTVFAVWLLAILGALPHHTGFDLAHWAKPTLSSTSRAIFNLIGTTTTAPTLDAPRVQNAAPSGTFGSAVWDPVSSAYIASGRSGIPFSWMFPSASYDPLPSSENFTLVNPRIDAFAFLELGVSNMRWYEHPASFIVLIAILGHVTDVVHEYKEVTCRGPVTRATTSPLRSAQNFQRAAEPVSIPKPPQATHKKRNKKKAKKSKKSKRTNETRKQPAFFNILMTVLGRIVDAVRKYKEASQRFVTRTTSSLLSTQILQRTPASLPQQPRTAHKKRSKKSKKKSKKTKKTNTRIETGEYPAFLIVFTAILDRIIDAVYNYAETSRRLVTQTISSLLSAQILRRTPEPESLFEQPQATHKKRNKRRKPRRKTKKTKKTLDALSNSPCPYPYPSTTSLTDDGADVDQTRVFGVLRGSAASNFSHDDIDVEADEYLRSVFNVPDVQSAPLMGWSDYEVEEVLGWHPPVEELDEWAFPGVPVEPFTDPLPSEAALAGLAAADADPARPFGFVRVNYVQRTDDYIEEAAENAMLNVALGLPFSMEPFTHPWQIYCFPHEQPGRYPPVEELDAWFGILDPRPMLPYDLREGPGPPLFVDIGDRWDE
ncbi:hypothetical protein C8Q73DRAFT_294613 [Cubamyces lactineus]|nr:hypothetical protein C8Q73DRAFT_294613 [Cubamyces lactineus]